MLGDLLPLIYLCEADSTSTHIYLLAAILSKLLNIEARMDINNLGTSFYFQLLFKQEKIAFQEVSGISKELNAEEILSGGDNQFKSKLPIAPTSRNLILKRVVVPVNSNLVTWCENSDALFRVIPNDISINLMDANDLVCMKWTFYNAYPIFFSFSDLKSQENYLAFESIELAYDNFQIFSFKES
jgi:phage tail-like protein